jgi:hypothetical protein
MDFEDVHVYSRPHLPRTPPRSIGPTPTTGAVFLTACTDRRPVARGCPREPLRSVADEGRERLGRPPSYGEDANVGGPVAWGESNTVAEATKNSPALYPQCGQLWSANQSAQISAREAALRHGQSTPPVWLAAPPSGGRLTMRWGHSLSVGIVERARLHWARLG